MWCGYFGCTWVDYVMGGLLTLAGVGLIGIIWAVIADSLKPTFSLKKDEWKATKSHTERYMTHILVGKVLVPQWHTRTVVDQWTRKK